MRSGRFLLFFFLIKYLSSWNYTNLTLCHLFSITKREDDDKEEQREKKNNMERLNFKNKRGKRATILMSMTLIFLRTHIHYIDDKIGFLSCYIFKTVTLNKKKINI